MSIFDILSTLKTRFEEYFSDSSNFSNEFQYEIIENYDIFNDYNFTNSRKVIILLQIDGVDYNSFDTSPSVFRTNYRISIIFRINSKTKTERYSIIGEIIDAMPDILYEPDGLFIKTCKINISNELADFTELSCDIEAGVNF